MIPDEAKNIFNDIVTNEMFEMDRQLAAVMGATQNRMAANGTLRSSMAALSLAQDATNSLKARGQLILSQLIRCLAVYNVTWDDVVVREASDLLRESIQIQAQVIRLRLFSTAPFGQNLPALRQQVEAQYAQEGPRLTNRLTNELRLAAVASRNQNAQSSGPTVTINGHVGAVQTGPASQATVTQHIDAGTKAQLVSGLQLYLEELARPENAGIQAADQLRDLIVETKVELEKPQPNALKVSGGLRTIAETTKFIGSLGPAYNVIKPLLGMFGIHLP